MAKCRHRHAVFVQLNNESFTWCARCGAYVDPETSNWRNPQLQRERKRGKGDA
jgi:hypothetical protein